MTYSHHTHTYEHTTYLYQRPLLHQQFVNGFPHFWEISKGDSKSKRLKIHTEIAMVHGGRPAIYVAWEDIASDPNLTCEILFRTLRREEEERDGGLPPVLYLQLDNCIRENKNTVFIGYVSWLVERRVFKEIYLSFLPVGHTHFDCDQCASCIGFAVRHVDITSVEKLFDILEHCYSPRPDVAFISDVADVSGLLNPGDLKDFPLHSSRIRFQRGCCTKEVVPGRELYMQPTSALHWRFRLDTEGKVFLQTRLTCDDEMWSELHYPFETEAPRPHDREVVDKKSGLEPDDLRCRAPRPLTETRRAELKSGLQNIRSRTPVGDWSKIEQVAQRLMNNSASSSESRLPQAGRWSFVKEGLGEEECKEEGSDQGLRIRPAPAIYQNQSLQNLARELRKTRGRADNELVIGNFVATTTHYTAETPPNQRNKFWVAKIAEIDADERQINVRWYNTVTVNNLDQTGNRSNRAKYRAWTKDNGMEWIDVSRVLTQFVKLTNKGGFVGAPILKRIKNAIELNAADERNDLDDAEPAAKRTRN